MSAGEPQINPTNVERDFVVFTTDLFRDEQPDDEIDQWFLGEDCARWLEAKFLALDGISPGVAPLEEDWHGWTFGIRAHGIWFWLNIWHWESVWVVGVEAKPGLLGIFRRDRTRRAKAMLCSQLDSILARTPGIKGREWLEAHPADLPRLVVTDSNTSSTSLRLRRMRHGVGIGVFSFPSKQRRGSSLPPKRFQPTAFP